jgi:hypothetical protein
MGILQSERTHAANEFPCAHVTPSTIMQPSYGRRADAPNVCEGYYEKAVSAPFIELISLTLTSPDGLGAISSPEIIVSMPPAARGSWHLLVQPLSVATPYRVDAPIGPASALNWNFAKMAAATHTTLKDVGFVATPSSRADSSTFAPVWILRSGEHAKDIPRVAYVTVRVTGKTSQVVWRSYATDASERSGELSWASAIKEPLYPEECLTVEIPLARTNSGLTIELKGTDATSNEIHPLRIVIPGDGS